MQFYHNFVNQRFESFVENVKLFVPDITIFKKIHKFFDPITKNLSSFPLSVCHGDFKSANIFYKDSEIPYLLDWQYLHVNKGVSDLVFLMVESIDFNENTVRMLERYYYQLNYENNREYTYDQYLFDLKCSLCYFPFFVCVWFNSEDSDKLLDKIFPIRFLKNVVQYYHYYLDDSFFEKLNESCTN